MCAKPRAAKKPYSSPSFVVLDASTAKATLHSKGDSEDPAIQKMICFADEQVNQRNPGSGSSSALKRP